MVYEALGKAHVPFGADGEGVYSTATLGCFNVIAQAAPLAHYALSEVRGRSWFIQFVLALAWCLLIASFQNHRCRIASDVNGRWAKDGVALRGGTMSHGLASPTDSVYTPCHAYLADGSGVLFSWRRNADACIV